MAIQLNLLPWREARRQRRANTAKLILIGSMVLGLLLSVGFYLWESARLNDHRKALALVTQVNNALHAQLKEKRTLDSLKATLNKQINAIESLQANRASVTHMIEELSEANDQSLFLTTFSLANEQVQITGIAKNDRQISNFMTALQQSSWYQEPKLISIVAQENLGAEVKQFTITSRLLLPGSRPNPDS